MNQRIHLVTVKQNQPLCTIVCDKQAHTEHSPCTETLLDCQHFMYMFHISRWYVCPLSVGAKRTLVMAARC